MPMTNYGQVGQIRSLRLNTTKRVLVCWQSGNMSVVPPNAAGINNVEWILVPFSRAGKNGGVSTMGRGQNG